MKIIKKILSLAVLALVPAFAFADDPVQNINKLNASKLLVEKGNENLLETDEGQKENARNALGILKNIEIPEEAENFERTYFAVSAKANLILGNYSEVISLWEKGKTGKEGCSEELKYFAACAYFCSEKYENCISLLKDSSITEQKNLLAKAYYKTGKLSDAEKEYELLNGKGSLSESGKLDYAKILYAQKKFKACGELVSTIEKEEAWLIAGGCSLAQKKYAAASAYYGKVSGNSQAAYLKGYALYKNGQYTEAGKVFETYIRTYENDSWINQGWNMAIQSWLMAGKYDKAEEACKTFINRLEKEKNTKVLQETVLTLGDVYSDQKKYDQAVALFSKYDTHKNDGFSSLCMYKTAVCYENWGKITEASKAFGAVYDKYPVSSNAEESLYRAGEVLYLNGLYKEAVSKLTAYTDAFTKGEWTESALYYEFDCYVKTGNKTQALLLGNKIISSKGGQTPSSNYQAAVLEEMYNLNYAKEDYENALVCARKLSELKAAAGEPEDPSLQNRISFMERILKGENRELVLAQAEYENAGGKSTLEGRAKGSAYAQLLFRDEETKPAAVKLAGEILTLQEKDPVNEREGAAINALILAEYFYEQNRKGEAAEKYLKAAEYSRLNGDDEKAAFSLYTAAECFVHLGKKGNATETANLLKELYPDSKYTSAVRSLLK